MLKPKNSAIIFKNIKDFNKVPKGSWHSHGAPFKALFYLYRRNKSGLLFCYIIARDCYGDLRTLPWKCGDVDMRNKLHERKIG